VSIPTLIQSYRTEAAVSPYSIVAFSEAATTSLISHGAAATDPLVGTTGKLGAAAGELADVYRGGLGEVTLGGTVAAGDPLTSNAAAKAIKATVAGSRIIGFADAPGVANDVIPYFAAPGVLAVGA
jgi:hypothetical protein